MSTHIGLYFPYFHFPEDDWVKVSALYWDKLYRIVPYGYQTKRDSDLIKILSDPSNNTSLVRNIHPEDFHDALNQIKISFIRLIENHTKEIVYHYGLDKRHEWSDNPYTAQYSPEGDPKLAYIFSEKIDPELFDILISRDLGTTRSPQGDNWLGMHPKLANVYMAALAETLAEKAKCHPVTNDPINYFAVSGFTFERLAQVLLSNAKITGEALTSDELESGLARIALKAVMPKNLNDVSIDKLLVLREKYAGEFGEFQDLIHKIVNEVPELKLVEGQQFVNDHLDAEYKKTIKPKLDELDNALNDLDIETIPTVINLETVVPKLLATGGLLAGATLANPALGVTSAVAMGLWKIISDKRKAVKSVIAASDVSFLMHVRDDLTPAGSLEWLAIQAGKLIDGT